MDIKLLARLPDQVEFNHGPFDLLAKFFLKADKMARDRGIRLSIRHDMENLAELNDVETRKGNWHPLVSQFDPRLNDLTPDDVFWMSGFNEAGEIVAAQAARVYDWTRSDLSQECGSLRMFYRDPDAQRLPGERWACGGSAASIKGMVCYSGSGWVRPDYRGRNMAAILPRISRAHALTRWGTDYTVSFVSRTLVDKGVAAAYGYKNVEFVVDKANTHYDDLDLSLVWMDRDRLVEDVGRFVSGEIAV